MNTEKSLILLRGLPGAGKTTLAHLLSENKYPVFSIDDYFIDTKSGVYKFNFAQNHLAYKQCETNTEDAMTKGVPKIFIHNTLTLDWEIEPYFKLAQKYLYTVFVATVENWHNSKNDHAISEEQIKKMAEKYKVKLV